MRYLLGVLGLILLSVLAIVLIGRGGNRTAEQPVDNIAKMAEYADKNATVIYTTDGRIVGEDTHKTVRITVTPSERKVELLTGYEGTVERSATQSNTSEAYKTFVYALARAGFIIERKTDLKDEKGTCPRGKRFIYELKDGGDEVSRLWSTSCSKNLGTFGGDDQTIEQLFQDQITDYRKFIAGVKL